MHDQETNAQSRGLKTEKSDPKARTTPKRNTTDEGIIWRLEPFDFREAHRNAISYFYLPLGEYDRFYGEGS
jgi:hypothetical protein